MTSTKAALREMLMSTRKVLCTGNPNNPNTIASAINVVFPGTTFIHFTNGYDFTKWDSDLENNLAAMFKRHNTFINASYIAPDVQLNLLNLCNRSAKYYDVFNIGSTHEYDNLGTKPEYVSSKQKLRDASLRLNTYRFSTCHMLLGSIKKADCPADSTHLDVLEIANTISWVLSQRFKVPLVCIDQPKEPW